MIRTESTLETAQRMDIVVAFAALFASTLAGCFTTERGDPPGVARESRAIGAACEWNIQCASDFCIPEQVSGRPTGWPDGTCSAPCPDLQCDAGLVCAQLDDGGYCLPPCGSSGEPCRDGYICHPVLETCLPDCRGGWECGQYAQCGAETGLCEIGSSGSPVGDPCDTATDCGSRICLAEMDGDKPTGWQEGMCSAMCADGQCATGQSCVRLDNRLFCLPQCGASCRAGYVCNDLLAVCLPDCRSGWDCGEGFDCGDNGQCRSQIQDLAAVGQPCTHDNQCETGICFAETDDSGPTGWAGGTCAGICGSALCGPSTGCITLDGANWCLAGCASDTECRTGYVCSDDASVCLPDCRLGWDCGALACSEQTGECETAIIPDTGRDLGQPCSEHNQCASTTCLLQSLSSWNSAICTQSCAGSCPTAFECASVAGAGNFCLPDCGEGQSCPSGYVCDTLQGACVPDCLSGWTCLVGTCRSTGLCKLGGGGPGPGGYP